MKACNMAETVSRDVNVVKTRQVSVLFCVQVPRRKTPAMSNCQLSEQKRTKASGFKRSCFQSKYLLANFLTFALNMCQYHFDINIRAWPQTKFVPLGLNLRGFPVCSLTHTVTPLLYGKLIVWKI